MKRHIKISCRGKINFDSKLFWDSTKNKTVFYPLDGFKLLKDILVENFPEYIFEWVDEGEVSEKHCLLLSFGSPVKKDIETKLPTVCFFNDFEYLINLANSRRVDIYSMSFAEKLLPNFISTIHDEYCYFSRVPQNIHVFFIACGKRVDLNGFIESVFSTNTLPFYTGRRVLFDLSSYRENNFEQVLSDRALYVFKDDRVYEFIFRCNSDYFGVDVDNRSTHTGLLRTTTFKNHLYFERGTDNLLARPMTVSEVCSVMGYKYPESGLLIDMDFARVLARLPIKNRLADIINQVLSR